MGKRWIFRKVQKPRDVVSLKSEHLASVEWCALGMPVFGQPYVEGGRGNMGVVSALLTDDGTKIGISVEGRVELDSLLKFLVDAKAKLAPYSGVNLDQLIDEEE